MKMRRGGPPRALREKKPVEKNDRAARGDRGKKKCNRCQVGKKENGVRRRRGPPAGIIDLTKKGLPRIQHSSADGFGRRSE